MTETFEKRALGYGHFIAEVSGDDICRAIGVDPHLAGHLELYTSEAGLKEVSVYTESDVRKFQIKFVSYVYLDTPSKPHEGRVIAEEAILSDNLNRLGAFIHGQTFRTLLGEDQILLQKQDDHMRAYVSVLRQRIARFTDNSEPTS